jgi:hypothetical protein
MLIVGLVGKIVFNKILPSEGFASSS